jgi:cytochrome P450
MNLIQFLFAGFDTTHMALTYSMFVMANHPEEMAKLQEEIDAHFADETVYL